MTTPRHMYRVDVCLDHDNEPHALIRTRPGDISWVWCPHNVRATSNASAKRKAIAAHMTQCQEWESEKQAYLQTVFAKEESQE